MANNELGDENINIDFDASEVTIEIYFVTGNIEIEATASEVSVNPIWQLVTDVSNLEDGDQIIITNVDSTKGLKAYSSGNNCPGANITMEDDVLTEIGESGILTLEESETAGDFYLFDGTYYLYAASSSSNYLKGTTTVNTYKTHGSWRFTYSGTNSYMSIIANGSTNRNVMQFNPNNGSPLFACYASASQTNLQVYKLS